jgi:hypothetical protein
MLISTFGIVLNYFYQLKIETTLNGMNQVLANIIWLFHFLVVLFVVFTPWYGNPVLLILHMTLCLSLLTHWITNNNVCSLSLIEGKLRGRNYTESFTHSLIAPLYDISKTQWSQITFILTIILFLVSLSKLINHPRIAHASECLRQQKQELKSDQRLNKKTNWQKFRETVMLYVRCYQTAFNA